MSRDTRYTYQYRIRCDATRLNLPGHVIAVGTPAIRHILVKMKIARKKMIMYKSYSGARILVKY